MNETQVMLKIEDWILQARTNEGPSYEQSHEAMNYNHICFQKALYGLSSSIINQGLIQESIDFKYLRQVQPIET